MQIPIYFLAVSESYDVISLVEKFPPKATRTLHSLPRDQCPELTTTDPLFSPSSPTSARSKHWSASRWALA